MVKKQQKKKRLRLRIKVVLKLLLFICIVALSIYYLVNLNIKNIYISGNEKIKDVTIIEKLGIKDYPKIYRLNITKMEEKLENLPLVDYANIKRNIFGELKIELVETKILFYHKYNKKYITANNKSIDDSIEYIGIPSLINFTPDTIFDDLIAGLNKIDYNIVKMINEIEYTPYKSEEGTTIDNNLFTLTMNDGNIVKIDTVNIKNLNQYKTIYTSLKMNETKRVVYLDTIIEKGDGIYSKTLESIEKEESKKEEEKDKKDE
jgi:cell division septal protein FtsQ